MKILKSIRKNVIYVFLSILILLWTLVPILWGVIGSFTPERNLLSKPPVIILSESTFNTYRTLLTNYIPEKELGTYLAEPTEGTVREGQEFKNGMLSSFIISISVTILVTILTILAGYAFSRYRFFGRKFFLMMMVGCIPLPIVAVVVPLIRVLSFLKIGNTLFGVILIYVAFYIPITLWLSYRYFDSISKDIEEASYVDGCTKLQAFFRVVVPVATPIIGTIAIITFLLSWGNFFIPLIFAPVESKTVTIVVANFVGKWLIRRNLMLSAGIITLIPPMLIVLLFNRLIVGGLTKGAVKE